MQEIHEKSEIYKALFAFSQDVCVINKDGEVSYGRTSYRYATYENVRAAIKEALKNNNLLVIHGIIEKNDNLQVTTDIIHYLSGQKISVSLPISSKENDPKDLGKLITYMKRYGLTTLLGLSCEEDSDAQTSHTTQKNMQVIAKMASDEFEAWMVSMQSPSPDIRQEAYKTLVAASKENKLSASQLNTFKKFVDEQKRQKDKEIEKSKPLMTYEELQEPRIEGSINETI